jgi:hypothetical protein
MLELCVFVIVMIAICVAANTKGWRRWISVSVVAIIFLPIAALGLWFTAMGMELEGIWPFAPLASSHQERPLPNGGVLVFDEKESRPFRKGPCYTDSVGYRPPGSDRVEPIASQTREDSGAWNLEGVQAYLSGNLVVVVTPGASDLFVRSHAEIPAPAQPSPDTEAAADKRPTLHSLPYVPGPRMEERWQRLSLHYPHGDAASTPIYSTFTGNSQEVLLKTRAEIAAQEGHEPSVQIAYFRPATRELAVVFDANKIRTYQVILELSEDGTRLSLHQWLEPSPKYATAGR